MNKNEIKKIGKNIVKKKAIFLDRDGTINFDKGYTYKFSDFKFRPNIIKGLKYLSKKKYLIFIVTNQAGVAKGKFKIKDLVKLHNQLLQYLLKKNIKINQIEYCPYHPNGTIKLYKKKSAYRKPGNKMIKKILKKWPVKLKESFMIGDKKSDMEAANKSKLYFEYVNNNFYKQVKKIEKKIINNY